MHRANLRVLSFPVDHPARRFLEAFVECQRRCVGRDIDWPTEPAVDQEWYSPTDRRIWKFSQFAYLYLSFDVVLDEWQEEHSVPRPSSVEQGFLDGLPKCLTLLEECEDAAQLSSNGDILSMIHEVRNVLRLREVAIAFRLKTCPGLRPIG